MTHIKSALEIAMERTEDVKSDRETLLIHELKNEGMRLVSEALRNTEKTEELKKRVSTLSSKDARSFMEGVSAALLTNLSLPTGDDFEDNLDTLKELFLSVSKEKKKILYFFEQLKGFLSQFIQNRKTLEENLEAQYEPRLRQKEDELYKRMGAKVHLEAQQDPEFLSLLHENRSKLEERYSTALRQVKQELTELLLSP